MLSSYNIEIHDIFFHWNLIEYDEDDNKFTDLAVAGNADFLVSNDLHFNVIKLIAFPPINVISGDDFLSKLP
ncbi:MAG: hypothetical protein QM802_21485 [Agriterribacter sp.]